MNKFGKLSRKNFFYIFFFFLYYFRLLFCSTFFYRIFFICIILFFTCPKKKIVFPELYENICANKSKNVCQIRRYTAIKFRIFINFMMKRIFAFRLAFYSTAIFFNNFMFHRSDLYWSPFLINNKCSFFFSITISTWCFSLSLSLKIIAYYDLIKLKHFFFFF